MHAADDGAAAAAGAARLQGHHLSDRRAARLPGNGAAVDRLQLRQNVLHALEHHQQHVSTPIFRFSISFDLLRLAVVIAEVMLAKCV